jgi:nitroreductase
MTSKMKELSFLTEHVSYPAKELHEPAPSEEQLEHILQAAMSAPDHGQLVPYRFLIIDGKARIELSEVFGQALRKRNPGADESMVKKQKLKPLRSPLIIVVIADITVNPKVPEIEQILSAGCAAQHIQLACSRLGFGSIWLTGDNSYDMTVYEALGMDLNERAIGFIYVGTPEHTQLKKDRPSAKTITSRWQSRQTTDFAI